MIFLYIIMVDIREALARFALVGTAFCTGFWGHDSHVSANAGEITDGHPSSATAETVSSGDPQRDFACREVPLVNGPGFEVGSDNLSGVEILEYEGRFEEGSTIYRCFVNDGQEVREVYIVSDRKEEEVNEKYFLDIFKYIDIKTVFATLDRAREAFGPELFEDLELVIDADLSEEHARAQTIQVDDKKLVLKLNDVFFGRGFDDHPYKIGTREEWVASIIIHEIGHLIHRRLLPELTQKTDSSAHEFMASLFAQLVAKKMESPYRNDIFTHDGVVLNPYYSSRYFLNENGNLTYSYLGKRLDSAYALGGIIGRGLAEYGYNLEGVLTIFSVIERISGEGIVSSTFLFDAMCKYIPHMKGIVFEALRAEITEYYPFFSSAFGSHMQADHVVIGGGFKLYPVSTEDRKITAFSGLEVGVPIVIPRPPSDTDNPHLEGGSYSVVVDNLDKLNEYLALGGVVVVMPGQEIEIKFEEGSLPMDNRISEDDILQNIIEQGIPLTPELKRSLFYGAILVPVNEVGDLEYLRGKPIVTLPDGTEVYVLPGIDKGFFPIYGYIPSIKGKGSFVGYVDGSPWEVNYFYFWPDVFNNYFSGTSPLDIDPESWEISKTGLLSWIEELPSNSLPYSKTSVVVDQSGETSVLFYDSARGIFRTPIPGDESLRIRRISVDFSKESELSSYVEQRLKEEGIISPNASVNNISFNFVDVVSSISIGIDDGESFTIIVNPNGMANFSDGSFVYNNLSAENFVIELLLQVRQMRIRSDQSKSSASPAQNLSDARFQFRPQKRAPRNLRGKRRGRRLPKNGAVYQARR